jgi:accessory colonization factor AcfC
METNTEAWFQNILKKYKGDYSFDLLTVLFLLEEIAAIDPKSPKIQKLATEAIKIVDELYKKTCPTCGRNSMEDVRPGKRQCRYCG